MTSPEVRAGLWGVEALKFGDLRQLGVSPWPEADWLF